MSYRNPGELFTGRDKNYILKEYNNKNGPCILNDLGYSRNNKILRQRLHEYAQGEGLEKYKCEDVNHNYFSKIDNEYKAYILGFIVGDGSLKKDHWLSIGINNKDDVLLKEIAGHLDYKRGVRYSKSNQCVYISINSRQIFKDLLSYGVIPNKSYKSMTNLYYPKKGLFRHYLRGLIDSDGCITYSYKRDILYGCVKFMQGRSNGSLVKDIYQKTLELYNIKASYNEYDDRYLIRYRGSELKRLIPILYNNSNIYLDRKYKKAVKILEEQDFGIGWCMIRDYLEDKEIKSPKNFHIKMCDELDYKISFSTFRSFILREGYYTQSKYKKGR